jgi:hypothetical protein
MHTVQTLTIYMQKYILKYSPQSTHRVVTAAFWRTFHPMMEKLAQPGEGGGCTARPPPFPIFTITYKVAVYAPAEWADTHTLFRLYQYMYSVVQPISEISGREARYIHTCIQELRGVPPTRQKICTEYSRMFVRPCWQMTDGQR